MAEVLANFVQSIVDMPAGLNSGDLLVTVADGSLFPAVGNYRLGIDDEILICTARDGNDLTVLRGQELRADTAHADKTLVAFILTAGALIQYVSEN